LNGKTCCPGSSAVCFVICLAPSPEPPAYYAVLHRSYLSAGPASFLEHVYAAQSRCSADTPQSRRPLALLRQCGHLAALFAKPCRLCNERVLENSLQRKRVGIYLLHIEVGVFQLLETRARECEAISKQESDWFSCSDISQKALMGARSVFSMLISPSLIGRARQRRRQAFESNVHEQLQSIVDPKMPHVEQSHS